MLSSPLNKILFFCGLITYLFTLNSCIINPKYDDGSYLYDQQKDKYPQNEELITKQFNDFKNLKNLQQVTYNKNSYTTESEKISSFSIGDPNAFLHLGVAEYKQHHKINISFLCETERKLPGKVYSNKAVLWKISDNINGQSITNQNGEINILFSNKDQAPYNHIEISTSKSNYKISLSGFLIINLNTEDCLN